MKEDNHRFEQAAQATGAALSRTAPVYALARRFEDELDLTLAAAEAGETVLTSREFVSWSTELRQAIGLLLVDGMVKRRLRWPYCSGSVCKIPSIDRAFGSIEQWVDWHERRVGRVFLHIVDFGRNAIDSRTKLGQAFHAVFRTLSEFERSCARQRARDSYAPKQEERLYPGPRMPMGFKAVKAPRTGYFRALPDPERRRIMMQVAELHDGRGLTFEQIATYLNRIGAPLVPWQKRWRHDFV